MSPPRAERSPRMRLAVARPPRACPWVKEIERLLAAVRGRSGWPSPPHGGEGHFKEDQSGRRLIACQSDSPSGRARGGLLCPHLVQEKHRYLSHCPVPSAGRRRWCPSSKRADWPTGSLSSGSATTDVAPAAPGSLTPPPCTGFRSSEPSLPRARDSPGRAERGVPRTTHGLSSRYPPQ